MLCKSKLVTECCVSPKSIYKLAPQSNALTFYVHTLQLPKYKKCCTIQLLCTVVRYVMFIIVVNTWNMTHMKPLVWCVVRHVTMHCSSSTYWYLHNVQHLLKILIIIRNIFPFIYLAFIIEPLISLKLNKSINDWICIFLGPSHIFIECVLGAC